MVAGPFFLYLFFLKLDAPLFLFLFGRAIYQWQGQV
jgi:hypothetical protein